MSEFRLRRGDSRTLDIANLVDGNGNATTFLDGDVLRFTVKRHFTDDDTDALVRADNDAVGGISVDVGFSTGIISITPALWLVTMLSRPVQCQWDLQLTRAGADTTLASGVVDVLPDVTLTP